MICITIKTRYGPNICVVLNLVDFKMFTLKNG